MKRQFFWMMAAILTICGSVMFTSCSKDDSSSTTDLNLAEKIIGKWMKVEQNGLPLPTDGKMVYTFVSPTKAYMSASIDASAEVGTHWVSQLETEMSISGNKVSLTSYSEEGATMVVDYLITDINDKEFTANHKVTITLGGSVVYVVEDVLRFEKVTKNYAPAIIGMWECEEIKGGETYNDPNARLEFKDDGTYNFYRRNDAGEWKAVTTREYQDYFVDGYLLNTRWKDIDKTEQREWWEIDEISDDEMKWTALRKNDDGTTFEQKTKWKKVEGVEVIDALAEKILGKWIEVEIDGQPAPNTGNSATTFISATKAYLSSSRPDYTETQLKWSAHREYDVKITGNQISLTGHPESEPELTLQENYLITSISATEIVAKYSHTTIREGEISRKPVEKNVRLVKTDIDYRYDVIGTWEGQTSSGLNVRWEIKPDGTYVYSRQEGDGDWETMVDYFNEYFADGYLFCARWKNIASGLPEQRQWWEIESIHDDVMKWKGLNTDPDGPTYAETAELRRVEGE